ncbi:MAG: glycerol-3-phosphate dehydrogenase/oxidase [Bacteroidales bacterium]|nr:glycerol-3-phosphate dehydrogenase/oxidase [Bacteroidales bacterium]
MNPFSILDRKNTVKELKETQFDLLIIGGGITGAGIALDAASRGLKVALIEMQDYASGTSSRSTKLVHGGLRYLEHLEFNVVRKIGHERDVVYRNASHIVIPEKMLLPVVKDGSLGYFTSSIGLMLYDFLAGVKESEKRQMLSREETIAREPLLENDNLLGGALYYEYKTDDSRLTIEVIKKAHEYGATLLNYAQATDFIYSNETVCGVSVHDQLQDEQYEIKAKKIVNATGIWTDELRKKDHSLKNKRLHITKGIHIVVSKIRFHLNQAIYFDVGDNRMVFAIPRFDVVYIGTTDTNYDNDYFHPNVETDDIEYLLKAINQIAPSAKLELSDVESVWAGLRPLIHEDGKSPSELSRKDEIFHSDSGLISIAGGKLTGYRLMAKEVVDIIVKQIEKENQRNFKKCSSQSIQLSGGEFDFKINTPNIEAYAEKQYLESKSTGISQADFSILFRRYGSNIHLITQQAKTLLSKNIPASEVWIRAEVWYTIQYEMAYSLSDFFVRRTGMIHFFAKKIMPMLQIVADEMQKELNWSDEVRLSQIENFSHEYSSATTSFIK